MSTKNASGLLAVVTAAVAYPQVDRVPATTPPRRYGMSDKIAKVALFPRSHDVPFLSGSDIEVDGVVLAVMN